MNWEDFEIKACSFLNDTYGSHALFEHAGGSDSTVSDIHCVPLDSQNDFYIECKHSPCQSGQFVLIPDYESKRFAWSPRNANPELAHDPDVQDIITRMNQEFDTYSNAGTSGVTISWLNSETSFARIIKKMYEHKRAALIITNGFDLIPLTSLDSHFDVTATYRIKKSGSNHVPRKYYNEVCSIIDTKVLPLDPHEITIRGKGLFCAVGTHKPMSKLKFRTNDGQEFIFSSKGNENGLYEVRKLCKTNNANVIFSLKRNKRAGLSHDDMTRFFDCRKSI